MMDESSANPPDLYAFADLGAGWYDRFKHMAWKVDQEWLQFSATCREYSVTNDCAIGQPLRTSAETLADLYRQIRQVGLDFAAADTYHDPLAPTRPINDTLALPVVAMPPFDLSQLPADDEPGLGRRLMETSGIVADPMLPKAKWLMHNASGWDWFLGFSYVSLSFIRDLDYLVASALFPGFGVAFQAARTGAAWGNALRDDTGYENAIIQTALLSLGAFGLYLAKLPPGSTLGPAAPQVTSSGALVMAPAAAQLDVAGRALVIASEIGNVLFAKNYSPHTPEDLFGRIGPTRTTPTGPQGGKPTGTPDRNPSADPQTLRGLEIEEHSAEVLAERGYRVHQQPGKLLNGKEPDFWIEDTIFDNIAPNVSEPNKIWVGVKDKILKAQTRRVIVNLERSDVVVDDELLTIFKEYPIEDLDEVILITKDQAIIQLYP